MSDTKKKATERRLLHAEPIEGLDQDQFADKLAETFCAAINAERLRRGLPPLRDE